MILERHLAEWQERLGVYSGMVEARRAAFESRLPATDRFVAEVKLGELRASQDALAQHIAAARANRDVAALATAEEAVHWRQLATVEADPQFAVAPDDVRQRHRVLKGVMRWDLDRQFRERLWLRERELRALGDAISTSEARMAAVAEARAGEPRRFEEFAARIAAIEPRVAAMRAEITATRTHQERGLVALAVQELEGRKQRLASYRVQARFALATIFDRAGAKQAAAGESP